MFTQQVGTEGQKNVTKTKESQGIEPRTLRFASERATAGPTTQGFGRDFTTAIILYTDLLFKLQTNSTVMG